MGERGGWRERRGEGGREGRVRGKEIGKGGERERERYLERERERKGREREGLQTKEEDIEKITVRHHYVCTYVYT